MELVIENFRNISTLKLDLDEEKVNFIYGISGSGKSSIISALSGSCSIEDKPVGVENEPLIMLNGNAHEHNDTKVFNEVSMRELILNPIENELAYEALIGDESTLNNYEEAFRKSVSELRTHLDKMVDRREKIAQLLSAFSDSRIKSPHGNKIPLNPKIQKELDRTTASRVNAIISGSSKYNKFILDGTKVNDDYENHICPFCKRKLSDSRYSKINDFQSITQSTFKTIFENTNLFSDLGIDEPSWTKKRSVAQFEKTLKTQLGIKLELDTIIDFCTKPLDKDMSSYSLPKKLQVSQATLSVFPEIKKPIEDININIIAYRALCGKMKTAFKSLLKNSKITRINSNLETMGIPYEIVTQKVDRSSRSVSYIIKHKRDAFEKNMGKYLSTGEKNILALLLFLEDEKQGTILFDDPVSSYDEYRRSQLFKRIIGSGAKTILVCSHDQSFIKQAAIQKYKKSGANPNIGQIKMLTNQNGNVQFKDIRPEDFGSTREFIISRLQTDTSLQYYQQIINLRMLCELDGYKNKGDRKKAAWGYTSGILHQEKKEKILKKLSEKNLTEESIIDLLNTEFGTNISVMPDAFEPVDIQNYSVFEKAILKRELGGVSSVIKGMLDDIVHLNNHLAIGLNPYIFIDYPTHLIEDIERD